MATKLTVYNEVMRELGSHPLANTTDANTRLTALEGAFTPAVEYMLSKMDWNFARRRAVLTGVADTSFSPYAYRYSRPSDYLRKIWVKTSANDEFQIEHTESGAVLYGFATTGLMEYMSDHADNYDPANWPPQFTRCLVLYLTLLAGPKLARTGDDDAKSWYSKLEIALNDAERQEAVYAINTQITASRVPVLRRAIEMLGQQLAGTVAINTKVDELRWAMNKAFDHTVRYVLEQAAWNFASKRALYQNGATGDANIPTENVVGIIEGYSVAPDASADVPSVAGFDYSYALPDDFLHKIWIKAHINDYYECAHQRLGGYMFTNQDPCIMEYVAEDTFTTDPDNWPATFLETVAAYLAFTVMPEFVIEENGKGKGRISAPQIKDRLEGNYLRKLSDAKVKDAIQQQPYMIPPGRFVQARMGGTNGLRRLN